MTIHRQTSKQLLTELEIGFVTMINGHQVHRIDEYWFIVGMSPTKRTFDEALRMVRIPR